MTEWQYMVLILVPKEQGDTLADQTECHERQLGNLGPRGWELVSVVGRVAYLKRRVPDQRRLRATTDRDLRALVTKALYAVLNKLERFPDVRQCHREGLACEYVYPYGFVPEGGCPRHDP